MRCAYNRKGMGNRKTKEKKKKKKKLIVFKEIKG